jgi:hypothetical protein
MASDKDTIYIDVDDEITGIIDKVQASDSKVVALVLPKRAAVFQSIVNMKLLKRAADSSDKNLALITTEAGLLPLAGVAGIHVAKTLNSKPEIPVAPKLDEPAEEAVDEEGEITAATAGAAAVGDLAGKPLSDGGMETLTLDDDKLPEDAPAAAPKPKDFDPPKGKGKKGKKFNIPDFNRFRLMLIAGGAALVLLIVFLFLAIKVWPHATITIDTDAQSVDSNVALNLSTTAKKLNEADGTVPAKLAQQQKVYTQQVATTGQKNNGNKASGSVNMSAGACSADAPSDVPAGTGLSSSGQTYITQSNTSFTPVLKGGKCTFQSTSSTTIIAQNPGSSYNGANSFSVAGRSDVSASAASSISGGTDNIVHSVNQNDINNAKSKINTNDPDVRKQMEDQLKKDGYYVIGATFSSGTPAVTQSANVGAVADNVTVTETVTYSMFGVHKGDLEKLVENDVAGQIDTSKQKVQDAGIDRANFNVENQSDTGAQVAMTTKAIAGPDIDTAAIQKNAAGEKPGKIKSDLESNPGIKEVDVNLSPFWVSSVPKNTDKIHIVIAKPKDASKH